MLANQYGVRLGVIGFLTTALFATHLLSQLPGGRLIDRRGARTMGMLALAVVVAGNALALATGVLAVGIAGRLVTGLGTGVGFIAGSDYVRAKLGTPAAQGLYGGFSVGGAGLAIAVVPLAALSVDWRAPYLAGLVIAAVFLAVLWAAPKDELHAAVRRGSPWAMLRDRRLYPLAVIHTASFGFSVILGLWTVSLFEHDGYRSQVGGAIGALTLLGGLVARPLGGRMMERWPRQTPLYVELSMLAAARRHGAAAPGCGDPGPRARRGRARPGRRHPVCLRVHARAGDPPRCARARDRLCQQLRDPDDPRRGAAPRLYLRATGRGRDRLRRRRRAMGGCRPLASEARGRQTPSSIPADLVAVSH